MSGRTATAPREKLSITVERSLIDEVRQRTENVSAFVNDAVRDRLYFSRLDEELARLEADGVRPNPAGVRWLSKRIGATSRRLARKRRPRKTA